MSTGMQHFLDQADAVAWSILIIMVLMSIGTWYLIIVKGLRLLREARRSRRFLNIFWGAPSLMAVATHLRETGVHEPFSHLVHHGFSAIEQHEQNEQALIKAGTPEEFLTRALKRAIEEDRQRLESGQTLLATVASAAPFIGLFGTVWGIYHALAAIGASGSASLDQVAGPVGEALIMTAIGLAVAIPASMAHNLFSRRIRTTLADLNSFAHDVFALFATGQKSQELLRDVAATSDRILARMREGS